VSILLKVKSYINRPTTQAKQLRSLAYYHFRECSGQHPGLFVHKLKFPSVMGIIKDNTAYLVKCSRECYADSTTSLVIHSNARSFTKKIIINDVTVRCGREKHIITATLTEVIEVAVECKVKIETCTGNLQRP